MEHGKAKWICAKHGRMAPELMLEWVGVTAPPVDPEAVAEALDVFVSADDLGRYTSVLAMSDRLAGILVNNAAEPRERRFAIAHELGHLVLHEAGEFRDADFRGDQPIEVEANLYAARLLMPAGWLEPRLDRGDSVEALAVAFGVTEARMAERVRAVRPPSAAEDRVDN
jgi:Zn-dependent peptidase ImmA (M78 family)